MRANVDGQPRTCTPGCYRVGCRNDSGIHNGAKWSLGPGRGVSGYLQQRTVRPVGTRSNSPSASPSPECGHASRPDRSRCSHGGSTGCRGRRNRCPRGYLKKVGPRTLQRWAGNMVNTHPALLPAYGGLGMYGDHVHRAVLADSATVTGASIHLVTPEYDEGRVLSQVTVSVEPGDDVASLRSRVQAAEKALLLDWLIKRCGSTTQVPNSWGSQSSARRI
jgi:Formyl transferase